MKDLKPLFPDMAYTEWRNKYFANTLKISSLLFAPLGFVRNISLGSILSLSSARIVRITCFYPKECSNYAAYIVFVRSDWYCLPNTGPLLTLYLGDGWLRFGHQVITCYEHSCHNV